MLTVLNDLHIGAIRGAGTTPTTQIELRKYLLEGFGNLLPDTPLMILGDLFDKEVIPISDVLNTYFTLADWLKKGHNLYLVAGNHDLSKTSSTMSSFDFLCKLLKSLYPNLVTPIRGGAMTPHGYVISHVPNQDLFNLELTKVPKCSTLYLHCNYDNNFAAQSDQSLNLSREQASKLPVDNIVIAHEHHTRTLGKVYIPGNQLASSVSDWASPQGKYMATVDAGQVALVKVADRATSYLELPWDALKEADQPFVKVVGKAKTEEAARVATCISKYRQSSKSLVITNGVEIESADGAEGFTEAFEGVQSFSVWDALKTVLTEEDIQLLEKL